MNTANRPKCKCHDEFMYPNNSNGGWRCRVKSLAAARRYVEKYPEKRYLYKCKENLRKRKEKLVKELESQSRAT